MQLFSYGHVYKCENNINKAFEQKKILNDEGYYDYFSHAVKNWMKNSSPSSVHVKIRAYMYIENQSKLMMSIYGYFSYHWIADPFDSDRNKA